MSGDAITLDRFLGGKITAAQPAKGFRAGHDTVLLAAAIPARAGERVLELGSGAGVASLCLAARVPGVEILGIEIDPALVLLASANAARNAMADRVRFIEGDAALVPPSGPFSHIFFNPPFYRASGQVSPVRSRDRAKRDTADAVRGWTARALALVMPGGSVTAILPSDRAEEMLEAAGTHPAILFPLFPRGGEAPRRMLVRIVNTGGSQRRMAAGLVLHAGEGNSTGAEDVLRHGAVLVLD